MKNSNVKSALKGKHIIMFILGVMLLFPCFKGEAVAVETTAEVVTAPMIMLERYDVTNEQIVPGEGFTLTLTFKNYSSDVAAKGVLIDVVNPAEIMPVYGAVSQVYIEEIPAGGTKEVSINYEADTVLEDSSVDFALTIIINGIAQNYITVRVPVGTDVPFYVLSAKFPSSVAVGENATSSLTFEVIGDANVRSVSHVVSVDGVAIGSNTIGSVTSGTTRTQNTTVVFREPGEYTVDIEIQYIDKADQQQSFLVGSKTITVYEEEESGVLLPQEIENDADDANTSLLLGLGGVVLLAVLVLVAIIRKRK